MSDEIRISVKLEETGKSGTQEYYDALKRIDTEISNVKKAYSDLGKSSINQVNAIAKANQTIAESIKSARVQLSGQKVEIDKAYTSLKGIIGLGNRFKTFNIKSQSMDMQKFANATKITANYLKGLSKTLNTSAERAKAAGGVFRQFARGLTQVASASAIAHSSGILLGNMLTGLGRKMLSGSKSALMISSDFLGFRNSLAIASDEAGTLSERLSVADNQLNESIAIAQKYKLSVVSVTKAYSKFVNALTLARPATQAAGDAIAEAKQHFENFAKFARVANLSAMNTRGMFLALEQMISKGVVSMEELRRQLGEHLPGAVNIAAKSMGQTTREFIKNVSKGQVASIDLVTNLGKVLAKKSDELLSTSLKKYSANVERLNNSFVLLGRSIGTILAKPVNAVLMQIIELVDWFNRFSDEGISASKALKDIEENGAGASDSIEKLSKVTGESKDNLDKLIIAGKEYAKSIDNFNFSAQNMAIGIGAIASSALGGGVVLGGFGKAIKFASDSWKGLFKSIGDFKFSKLSKEVEYLVKNGSVEKAIVPTNLGKIVRFGGLLTVITTAIAALEYANKDAAYAASKYGRGVAKVAKKQEELNRQLEETNRIKSASDDIKSGKTYTSVIEGIQSSSADVTVSIADAQLAINSLKLKIEDFKGTDSEKGLSAALKVYETRLKGFQNQLVVNNNAIDSFKKKLKSIKEEFPDESNPIIPKETPDNLEYMNDKIQELAMGYTTIGQKANKYNQTMKAILKRDINPNSNTAKSLLAQAKQYDEGVKIFTKNDKMNKMLESIRLKMKLVGKESTTLLKVEELAIKSQIPLGNAKLALLEKEAIALDKKLKLQKLIDQYVSDRYAPAANESKDIAESIATKNFSNELANLRFETELNSAALKKWWSEFEKGKITIDEYRVKGKQLGETYQVMSNDIEKSSNEISVAIGNVLASSVDNLAESIFDFAVNGKSSFGEFTKSILSDISKIMLKMYLMKTLFGNVNGISSDGKITGGIIGKIMNTIFNPVDSSATRIGATPGSFRASQEIGLATGTNYIPNDGLRFLHKGEAVVPKKYNNKNDGVVVNITNNTSSNVSAKEVPNGNGGINLEVLIEEQVETAFSSGRMDDMMSLKYGVQPVGV